MAIAPSKLGRVVSELFDSDADEGLVRRLRETGLVKEDVSDADRRATFQRAREEHASFPPGQRELVEVPGEGVTISGN